MFDPGEKVVCVDDKFHPEIACLFTALPVKGTTYTIRDCEMGRNKWVSAQKGWDSVDMKVLLVELTNPLDPSTLKGCPSELGFAARRFAPLETLTHTEEAKSANSSPPAADFLTDLILTDGAFFIRRIARLHPHWPHLFLSSCAASFSSLLALLPLLPSCQSMNGGPIVAARNQAILAEPRGDFWIGRRYFVDKTRFWGYVRRPGQLWDNAQLVVMDESRIKTPDRLPELPTDGGLAHGYDHNYEYRLTGNFSGRKVYDPNADMELPVFSPGSYEIMNRTPGFLFSPTDRYSPKYIPAREVPRTTPARM